MYICNKVKCVYYDELAGLLTNTTARSLIMAKFMCAGIMKVLYVLSITSIV